MIGRVLLSGVCGRLDRYITIILMGQNGGGSEESEREDVDDDGPAAGKTWWLSVQTGYS